jgi:hypothetical protein
MEEQVSADLVFCSPLANGKFLDNAGADAKKAEAANPRAVMELTPALEEWTVRGRPMRIGYSLPLPVRSQPPETADVAAEVKTAILSNGKAKRWQGVARGETAPPNRGSFHLTGIFPLPISTPEPESIQGGRQMVQKIAPRFLSSPISQFGKP